LGARAAGGKGERGGGEARQRSRIALEDSEHRKKEREGPTRRKATYAHRLAGSWQEGRGEKKKEGDQNYCARVVNGGRSDAESKSKSDH